MSLFDRRRKPRGLDPYQVSLLVHMVRNHQMAEEALIRYPDDETIQGEVLKVRESVFAAYECLGVYFPPSWSVAIPLPPEKVRRGIDVFLCSGSPTPVAFGPPPVDNK